MYLCLAAQAKPVFFEQWLAISYCWDKFVKNFLQAKNPTNYMIQAIHVGNGVLRGGPTSSRNLA